MPQTQRLSERRSCAPRVSSLRSAWLCVCQRLLCCILCLVSQIGSVVRIRTGCFRLGALQSHDFKMRSGNTVRTDGRDTYCFGPPNSRDPNRSDASARAAPAPAPQENEGDAGRRRHARAERGRAAAAVVEPFDALKKGFESAVQSATNNPDYKIRRDAQRRPARPARSTPSRARSEYKFGDLSRLARPLGQGQGQRAHGRVGIQVRGPVAVARQERKDKVAELVVEGPVRVRRPHEAHREPRLAAHDEG